MQSDILGRPVSQSKTIGDSDRMSSPADISDSSRGQQTLFEATASQLIHSFPRGIILRAEYPNKALEDFLRGNTLLTYVMINFSDVEELLEDSPSLDAVLEPWHVPIITATDPDEVVRSRTRDNIRRILKQVQPAIYIPDAGTVYMDEDDSEQLGGIQAYKTRLRWLMQELERQDWEIRVMPLAKGNKQWHFERYVDLFERHGFTEFAFYTRQYCGGDAGNRINDLLDHINNFITVIDPDNVLAIARHGPTHLEKLPPRVTGAAGFKQFVDYCRDETGQFSDELFSDWRLEWKEHLFVNHDMSQPKFKEYKAC